MQGMLSIKQRHRREAELSEETGRILRKTAEKMEQRQKEEIRVDRVKGVGGGREEKRGNSERELQELRKERTKVTKNLIIFSRG